MRAAAPGLHHFLLSSGASAPARQVRSTPEGRSCDLTDAIRRHYTVWCVNGRTYFRTGTVIVTDYSKQTVTKKHPDRGKIRDEINWYRSLPADLTAFAPALVNVLEDEQGYEMTLIPGPNLAELWVFGAQGWGFWEVVLNEAADTIRLLHAHPRQDAHDAGVAQRTMYVDKTLERLQLLEPAKDVTLPAALWDGPRVDGKPLPGLLAVRDALESRYDHSMLAEPRPQTIIHGDFHFGNLFRLPQGRSVIMIDPRGSFAGPAAIHGDPVYDYLKLGHSIVGKYDQTSLGQVRARYSGTDFSFTQDSLSSQDRPDWQAGTWIVGQLMTDHGLGVEDFNLGVSLLLLSLAALHGDPALQTTHLLRGLQLFGESF